MTSVKEVKEKKAPLFFNDLINKFGEKSWT